MGYTSKHDRRGTAPASDYYFGINREFNEDLTACGDKVVLRKHEKLHERNINGIVIPSTVENVSTKLCKATVVSVGPDVPETIEVGSVVLYDQWSVYYDTHPIVVTRSENIILVCEEEEINGNESGAN